MTATPLTPERLREIAALCEAATPGPWRWGDWRADFGLLESEFRCTLEHSPEHGEFDGQVKRHRDEGGDRVLSVEDDVENPADKRLIAASRTIIPELLAEVTRLRSDLDHAVSENFAFNVKVSTEINDNRTRIAALESGLREACGYISSDVTLDDVTVRDRLLALANNTTKETT